MVNTEIGLIIIFVVENGKAIYSQGKKRKKELELSVTQIMNSLLQNAGLN